MKQRRLWMIGGLVAVVLILMAFGVCSRIPEDWQQPTSPKPRLIDAYHGKDLADKPLEVSLMLAIANYSSDGLGAVYINEVWAAGMLPKSSGNPGTCCVSLPRIWKPGTKVRVAYRTTSMFLRDEKSFVERDVLVPYYPPFFDGALYFLYFPDDQVRVVATASMVGYPNFGYPIDAPHLVKEAQELSPFLEQTAWTDKRP